MKQLNSARAHCSHFYLKYVSAAQKWNSGCIRLCISKFNVKKIITVSACTEVHISPSSRVTRLKKRPSATGLRWENRDKHNAALELGTTYRLVVVQSL